MKAFPLFSIILSIICLSVLKANIPIPYSGKLSVDGINHNGEVDMVFEISDENGSVHWRNGEPKDSIKVRIQSGKYFVLLGGQGMNELDPELFQKHDELYLKVLIDLKDGSGFKEVGPAQRITSTAYAKVSELSKLSMEALSAQTALSMPPGTITREMLANDILADLNRTFPEPTESTNEEISIISQIEPGTITREMLSDDILADLNRSVNDSISSEGSNQATVTVANLGEEIIKYFTPSITNQPSPVEVYESTTASFSVTGEGKFLTYQWMKDGIELPGETNSTLTITTDSSMDESNYTVLVGNDFGSVESIPVRLSLVETLKSWSKEYLQYSSMSDFLINDNGNIFLLAGDENGTRFAKLDPGGNLLIEKNIPVASNGALSGGGILKNPNGDFFMIFNTSSDEGGYKSEDSRGGQDLWIVKVDDDGNKIWDKTLGGNGIENNPRITELTNGDYIVCGTSSSTASGDKSIDSNGSVGWFLKLDSQGNKQWDKMETNTTIKDCIALDNNKFGLLTTSDQNSSNILIYNSSGEKLSSQSLVFPEFAPVGYSKMYYKISKRNSDKYLLNGVSLHIKNGLQRFVTTLTALDENLNPIFSSTSTNPNVVNPVMYEPQQTSDKGLLTLVQSYDLNATVSFSIIKLDTNGNLDPSYDEANLDINVTNYTSAESTQSISNSSIVDSNNTNN